MATSLWDTLLASPPLIALASGAVGFVVGAVAVGVRALTVRRARVQAAVERMRPVLKGKIAEQLAPHLAREFVFSSADARFIGDPIDYVVFDGYAEGGDVEVVLVEVKTQNARLSRGQKRVRQAVEAGRVRFLEVRL